MMKRSLRIVFAYCADDPWIAVLARDLQEVSRTPGHELYVIAAGKQYTIERNSYINTDSFYGNYYLSTVFKTLRYPAIDLTELTEIEALFVRQFGDGEQESTDAIHRRLQVWLAEAMVTLKIIQPDVVIVWNGLYSKRAVYVKAAHYLNIPVYYAEKGMLPNSWYIDPQGVNVLSSVAGKKPVDATVSGTAIDQFKKRLHTIDKKGESAWEQPCRKDTALIRKDLGLTGTQKVLFFPGQVDYDTNIVLFSEHFIHSLDALTWLVHGLPKDEFFIVAKPHPKGNAKAEAFEKVLGNKGVVLSEINVLDAIELADCIVSINSTIAFEAAIRAKPVLLLGQGILCTREYVSTYMPGRDACEQVVGCIARYAENREALHRSALSFAAYLDAEYYAYREDQVTTERLMRALTDKIPQRNGKLFEREEIAALLQDLSAEDFERSFIQGASPGDITNWFSAGMLAKALFEKIRNRCIPWAAGRKQGG